jgi:purine-binding chemotaxis protein CheW
MSEFPGNAADTDHISQEEMRLSGATMEQSLLIFQLGSRFYGLLIEFVEQVIPMLKRTTVPQFEHIIDGVINIHGESVPVICGRRHLKLPAAAVHLNTPIILIRLNERLIGLIVDEVMDVAQVPVSRITAPNALLPANVEVPAVLLGIVFQNTEPIFVLDTYYFLSPEQASELERVVSAVLNSLTQNEAVA